MTFKNQVLVERITYDVQELGSSGERITYDVSELGSSRKNYL